MLSFDDILPTTISGGGKKHDVFNKYSSGYKPQRSFDINKQYDYSYKNAKPLSIGVSLSGPKEEIIDDSSHSSNNNYSTNNHIPNMIKKQHSSFHRNKFDKRPVDIRHDKQTNFNNSSKQVPIDVSIMSPIEKIDDINAPSLKLDKQFNDTVPDVIKKRETPYEYPISTPTSNKVDLSKQISSKTYPIQEVMYEIPRIENRFINITSNPYQNISKLNYLYEDFIPDQLMPHKILTVNDRFNLSDYIRKNILEMFEYETDKVYNGSAYSNIIKGLHEYDNDGLSKIFTKIKSVEENPNFDPLTYEAPKHFRIFKSCYPIVKNGNNVSCSKSSQSILLRIYHTPLHHNTDDTTKSIIITNPMKDEQTDMHIISEFAYLMGINSIVQRKECPCFPICYGIIKNIYDNKIKFNRRSKILKIESEQKTADDNNMEKMTNHALAIFDFIFDNSMNNHYEDYNKIKATYNSLRDKVVLLKDRYQRIIDLNLKPSEKIKLIHKLEEIIKKSYKNFDLSKFDKWLVDKKEDDVVEMTNDDGEKINVNVNDLDNVISFALSEAPTYSYDEWIKPKTISKGGIIKVTDSGWHSDVEQDVFMFQLLYTFMVMLKNRIYIPNFSKDNIFISKSSSLSAVNKLYVYKIDGIKYYIPNTGCTVMIDQRYATTDKEIGPYVKNLNDNVKINCNDKDLMKQTIINMKKIIQDVKKDKFNSLIDPIISDINENEDIDIQKIINVIRNEIINYFTKYTNNRCGTILSAEEYRYLNGSIMPLIDYECGELVLQSIDNDTRYKIVQIMSLYNEDSTKVNVQTKDGDTYKIEEIEINQLYSFKNNSIIKQFKDEYNRVSENIIDTFTFKSVINDSLVLRGGGKKTQYTDDEYIELFNKDITQFNDILSRNKSIYNKIIKFIKAFNIFINEKIKNDDHDIEDSNKIIYRIIYNKTNDNIITKINNSCIFVQTKDINDMIQELNETKKQYNELKVSEDIEQNELIDKEIKSETKENAKLIDTRKNLIKVYNNINSINNKINYDINYYIKIIIGIIINKSYEEIGEYLTNEYLTNYKFNGYYDLSKVINIYKAYCTNKSIEPQEEEKKGGEKRGKKRNTGNVKIKDKEIKTVGIKDICYMLYPTIYVYLHNNITIKINGLNYDKKQLNSNVNSCKHVINLKNNIIGLYSTLKYYIIYTCNKIYNLLNTKTLTEQNSKPINKNIELINKNIELINEYIDFYNTTINDYLEGDRIDINNDNISIDFTYKQSEIFGGSNINMCILLHNNKLNMYIINQEKNKYLLFYNNNHYNIEIDDSQFNTLLQCIKNVSSFNIKITQDEYKFYDNNNNLAIKANCHKTTDDSSVKPKIIYKINMIDYRYNITKKDNYYIKYNDSIINNINTFDIDTLPYTTNDDIIIKNNKTITWKKNNVIIIKDMNTSNIKINHIDINNMVYKDTTYETYNDIKNDTMIYKDETKELQYDNPYIIHK